MKIGFREDYNAWRANIYNFDFGFDGDFLIDDKYYHAVLDCVKDYKDKIKDILPDFDKAQNKLIKVIKSNKEFVSFMAAQRL